ncbi:hypothetical protein [Stutzerimonas tarimensis]|uniref:Uncharacterized protein n=1 Tax=Stutzerimonas tarimensis TaxID=1507735 RepID=A0ABV7T5E2_9GAMM
MVSRARLQWLAFATSGALGALAVAWDRHEAYRRSGSRPADATLVHAARRLNRGAGVLAGAVALDSALEHYRGEFENRAMYTPLATSSLALLASSEGLADRAPHAGRLRNAIYIGTVLTGAAGSAFHLWNVAKRPGGFGWTNLFYAAPLGAPAALVLSGVLGHYAERLRSETHDRVPKVIGLPAGKSLALMTAAGLIGTSAEAGLLHFRGAFQNPAMFFPVSAPPLSAALLAGSALARRDRPRLRRLSRLALRFTALMGLAGSLYHALGVARNHGGWHNWRQNLQSGPPLPAPPAFTGLALAGLAAQRLLDEERQALQRYKWWDG